MEVLRNTPSLLASMLKDLSPEWTEKNEGGESWSAYDIIGHLIHGEKTDWIPRARIILSDLDDKTFVPFDRFAQFKDSEGKSLEDLLEEFQLLRTKSLNELSELQISLDQLDLQGIHPALGPAKLKELLAAWVVHDLNHIAQISRVMAHQYKNCVGPWKAYLRILN